MRTRTTLALIIAVQAAMVVALIAAVASRRIPLGLPGEWEWLRVKLPAPPLAILFAGLGCVVYALFAALGMRSLARDGAGRWREAAWVGGLLVAAVAIQVAIPCGAADEYDLTRWAYVNYFGASTGYYQVARDQAVRDPARFFAAYPEWIQGQDSLHIGTHPPGLIALQCGLLRLMDRNPDLAKGLLRTMPPSTATGFRTLESLFKKTIPRADRATLYASSLLTLLFCAGTVVPLYLLARATLPAAASWATAAFWPLVPAANLFQPDADPAYPFVSTLALALACWAARPTADGEVPSRSRLIPALLCGLVLAAGMFFTLAFLPVGLVVALAIAGSGPGGWGRKVVLVTAVGVGFLALTAATWTILHANPIPVWRANLANHARFYVEYPRTYLAWLLINPVELTIALGLPAVVWAGVGLGRPRALAVGFWATVLVLVLLNLTGRNMGEVARLWLLFMPPLLLATGAALTRLGGGPLTLAASLGLLAAQTLWLQALVQVVYPV